MEPTIVDKTAARKRRNDPAKKRSTDRDLSPDKLARFQNAEMVTRINQALLDEPAGLQRKEIERRLELDPGDTDEMHKFGRAFAYMRDQGMLARTSTGYKRVKSPFVNTTGSVG